MGPTWVLSAPCGPHVGPMNLAIRDDVDMCCFVTVMSSVLAGSWYMYRYHSEIILQRNHNFVSMSAEWPWMIWVNPNGTKLQQNTTKREPCTIIGMYIRNCKESWDIDIWHTNIKLWLYNCAPVTNHRMGVYSVQYINFWKIVSFYYLTHCGLVTPYGDRNLDQHWLR